MSQGLLQCRISRATILFILSLSGLSQSGNRAARQLFRHGGHGDRHLATVLERSVMVTRLSSSPC